MPVLLTEFDVRTVLPMADLVDAMESAIVQYSTGQVEQPVRTVLEVGAQRAFFGVMPASVVRPRALGTKLVTVFPSNAAAGRHTHLATIILLDPDTGELLAIMDGRFITEARTAAVSAVSARLLAREDAATLGIIGSGVQARSHLEALGLVRALTRVRVWSPNQDHLAAFVREMRHRTAAEVHPAMSAREAVDGADIVVLATASKEPVVESAWIADGTHICAVGACRPDHREMETALVARARVFVDSRAGAETEAGDLVIPIQQGAFAPSHIAAELGEVAAGRAAGRTAPAEVTVFKSLGMAVEDVVAAHLAYERATARGLGRGAVI
ncbi:alanine dehydrogenase [soil metagenome]